MTKIKKKTAPTSITVNQIKSWLLGILEFQKEDWVPDSVQWNTIKDRIFALEDTVIEKEVVRQDYYPAPHKEVYKTSPLPVYPEELPPSLTAAQQGVTYPPIPVKTGPPIASGLPQIKTPSIDTSTSEYRSPFD